MGEMGSPHMGKKGVLGFFHLEPRLRRPVAELEHRVGTARALGLVIKPLEEVAESVQTPRKRRLATDSRNLGGGG